MIKRGLILGTGLAVVLALTPGVSVAQSKTPVAPEKVVYDAASAMEYFKSLSGDGQAGAPGHEHGNSPGTGYGSSPPFQHKANGSVAGQNTARGLQQ